MSEDTSGYTREPLLRNFGAVLRAYREAAGLSRPQLAEKLGCKPGWIEKLENAHKPPSEATADDLDTFFDTGPARPFWNMWREIKREGIQVKLPSGFPGFIKREAEAAVMYVFENMSITGLFQTPQYAREVIKAGRKPEEIEHLEATRMERQAILECDDPPQIVAVFDEGVIRRIVGNREIMRAQLQRLIEIAQMPKVTLQIVPSTAGAYPGMLGALTILGFKDGPDIVYTEGYVSGELYEDRVTVMAYTLSFDLIRGSALPADESLSLIQSVLEGL